MLQQTESNQDAIWRSEYPFKSRFLKIDGHSIHYLDEGNPANLSAARKSDGSPKEDQAEGPNPNASNAPNRSSQPISPGSNSVDTSHPSPKNASLDDNSTSETFLFVHGNPTWSFYWRKLVQALSSQGHRCVAIDHLGCGLSDKPQDYDYCLESHVKNLRKLVTELDLKNITLVAHDWGGAIGLGAAVAESDRFARMVLLNTAAFPPPYIPLRIQSCRIPLWGTVALRGLNLFSSLAMTMAVEKKDSLSEKAKAGLLAPYNSWANRVAVDRFVKDIPASPKHRTWATLKDIEAKLPTLAERPVQLIWGMKDWCFRPECMTRFQTIWPHARSTEIANAGHFVVEEATEQVLDSIQSLVSETR